MKTLTVLRIFDLIIAVSGIIVLLPVMAIIFTVSYN